MVVLYVAGQRIGTSSDLDRLLPEYLAKRVEIELRDDEGKSLGRIVPDAEPIIPWHPEVTGDDITRMIEKRDGVPLSEIWKRLGVK